MRVYILYTCVYIYVCMYTKKTLCIYIYMYTYIYTCIKNHPYIYLFIIVQICIKYHIYIYIKCMYTKPGQKFFLLTSYSNPLP